MNEEIKVVGFDYYRTITEHPDMMKGLSQVFRAMGCRVLVISAVPDKQDPDKYFDTVSTQLDQIGFYYNKVHIVSYKFPLEVPELKLAVALREQVKVFFDDRSDVIYRMKANNIFAIKTPAKIK